MAYRAIDRKEASHYLKMLNNGQKTPVTLAMELATKLGVVANFEEAKDLKWSLSSFKFNARLGDIQAVGVASSKKEAKQNSAKELIRLIENESESPHTNVSMTPRGISKYENYSSFSTPMSSSDSPCDRNSVGELQNLAAKNRWQLPEYEYDEPIGEAHSKTFTCLVRMMSGLECTGVGSSKKAAKKHAAEKVLDILQVDGYDAVDAQTPISQTGSSSYSNSSPEILDNSDLEGYNSSSSDGSSPATKLDFSNDIDSYDELSQQKLESWSERDGLKFEYIQLPSQSKKGQYQMFLKLEFTSSEKQKHPIVTHGSGETLNIAKCRAAERALKHLELVFSVQ